MCGCCPNRFKNSKEASQDQYFNFKSCGFYDSLIRDQAYLDLFELSVGDFIYRITYYTKISEVTLISSLILMERYCKNNNIILTVYNIHRLLFISIMVNIKFMEDKHFLNSFYAMICDVKLSYLNKMEYEFLSGIQFQLLINKNVYYKYRNLILKQE